MADCHQKAYYVATNGAGYSNPLGVAAGELDPNSDADARYVLAYKNCLWNRGHPIIGMKQ